MSRKITKKPKRFDNGGFLNNTGDFLRNYGLAMADSGMGMLGMNNIIQDDAYRGTGAEFTRKGANISGTIGKMVLPMAAQTLGIPAPVTGAALGALGQMNPEAKQAQTVTQPVTKQTNLAPMYPNGGIAGANAEVEKQENTLNPDGSTTQFNGPSHEQGGIKIHLDPNTLIFSDKIKINGKTIADLNKSNMTSKEEKIVNDTKSSSQAKKSAELMKMAKNNNSIELFKKQEMLKYLKANTTKSGAKQYGEYKMGGQMPKYDGGGLTSMEDNTPIPSFAPLKIDNQLYNIPEEDMIPSFGRTDRLYDMSESNPTLIHNASNYKNRYTKNGAMPPVETENGYGNWGKLAGQAGLFLANNAGNIYDISRAKNIENRQYEYVKPELLDSSADIAYNKQVYAQGKSAVKNASMGNASTYLNNIKDLSINQMLTNAKIKQSYANSNAQIKNQVNQYNNQIKNQEIGANAQIRANQRNMTSNAISNMGQNAMGQYGDYNKMTRDKQALQMIIQMYPQIAKDPNLANILKEIGG